MYHNKKDCKGTVYVIKEGDTLYKIAREYDLRVIDLLRANPYVNVYNLQIGDELCLPTLPNSPVNYEVDPKPEITMPDMPIGEKEPTDNWNEDYEGISDESENDDNNYQNMQIYEVCEGDTLADLMNYFQTDYEKLTEWNPSLRDLPIPQGVILRFPHN